jgi:hypothetical protein
MTEQVEVTPVEVQVETPVQVESPVESAPVAQQETEAPVVEQKQERMHSEKEVQRIAAKEKREGIERGRRMAMEEFQRQQQSQSQPQGGESMGGMDQMSQDQMRQMIQQEAMKMSNLALAQKIESNFLSKIDQAREKYDDFDDKYAALNIEAHPNLVLWMDGLDNVGDMVYDMASNPEKVASVMMLANSGFPQLAQQKLAQLSASIKANETAKKQPVAPAPLSQIQPTAVGTGNGFETVTDFRSASWLRG